MPENCLFPAVKLYEDEEVVAFRDIAPQAPLHVLVIPKKHLEGPAAVAVEDEQVVGRMMRVGNEIAVREGFPQYRTVCNNGAQAGQTVFHLHMHIIGGRSMNWPPG
jgi:histidine triad (HIT) family protein